MLRRTSDAVRRFGAVSGVQLTGPAGIGKTALAERVISLLGDERWAIAVSEGPWNPTALINATAEATRQALPEVQDKPEAAVLREVLTCLTGPGSDDDRPKLAAITRLLDTFPLLIILDGFEQNLISEGKAFLDPAVEKIITNLADAANTGALLVTSRYPLPGQNRRLIEVALPALSSTELRRLFLRLPGLAYLNAEYKRLVIDVTRGNLSMIEVVDAMLRGGRSNSRYIQARVGELVQSGWIDLDREHAPTDVLEPLMRFLQC